jgi:hypothetical protein
MSDTAAIQKDIKQRGITRLCHFMQSRKLSHVLTQTQALLPTQQLRDRHPDVLDVTDEERYDGHLNHVCCSIQYPNSWYFRKIHDRDPLFTDWVIVYLNPALVWERETLFSPRNAAAQGGALLQPGWQGWQALFASQVTGAYGQTRTRTARMLNCCPTDDQAEVLAPDAIPQHYITAVVVKTAQQAHKEQTRLAVLGVQPSFSWIVAPALFTPDWSDLVRQGQRPDEKKL